MFADTKWGRWLLTRSRRSPGSGRRTWRRCDHHRHDDRDDLVLIVVVILIVVVDLDHHPDLDLDVFGLVQFDRITLERFGGRGIGRRLIGVDGGVGWFFGHSGSYVTDR